MAFLTSRMFYPDANKHYQSTEGSVEWLLTWLQCSHCDIRFEFSSQWWV